MQVEPGSCNKPFLAFCEEKNGKSAHRHNFPYQQRIVLVLKTGAGRSEGLRNKF